MLHRHFITTYMKRANSKSIIVSRNQLEASAMAQWEANSNAWWLNDYVHQDKVSDLERAIEVQMRKCGRGNKIERKFLSDFLYNDNNIHRVSCVLWSYFWESSPCMDKSTMQNPNNNNLSARFNKTQNWCWIGWKIIHQPWRQIKSTHLHPKTKNERS